MLLDVRPDHLKLVQDILRQHVPDREVWAFGSRAIWTARDTSDLDLCIVGDTPLGFKLLGRLRDAFSESNLPYKVDVVDWASTSASFRKIIQHGRVVVQNGRKSSGMADEWPTVAVSEVAEPVLGGTPRTDIPDCWGGAIPWATAKDIAGVSGRYVLNVPHTITRKGLDESAAKSMPRGTVVITARGTVGAIAQLGTNMAFNQTCYGLITTGRIDQDYLYYALRSSLGRIRAISYGTVFDTITKRSFDQIFVPLPSPVEQRAIAHILGMLDDKIELNRRMSETLEGMARALFKSWFVDFDPVRAKAEGRDPGLPKHLADLFPDSFEDSELGEIPRGWEIGSLAGFSYLNPESWSKDTRPDTIQYVDLANTKWGRIEAVTPYVWKDAPSRAQRVLRPGDTIVGTVRPGNGSYAFVAEDGLTGSTGFAVLRPPTTEYREFVYLAATTPENIKALAHLADGGAYPAVRSEVIIATQVARPDEQVIAEFAKVSGPLLTKMSRNERESRTIAALRDTLLPKLICGELRVKHTEPSIKEVTV